MFIRSDCWLETTNYRTRIEWLEIWLGCNLPRTVFHTHTHTSERASCQINLFTMLNEAEIVFKWSRYYLFPSNWNFHRNFLPQSIWWWSHFVFTARKQCKQVVDSGGPWVYRRIRYGCVGLLVFMHFVYSVDKCKATVVQYDAATRSLITNKSIWATDRCSWNKTVKLYALPRHTKISRALTVHRIVIAWKRSLAFAYTPFD